MKESGFYFETAHVVIDRHIPGLGSVEAVHRRFSQCPQVPDKSAMLSQKAVSAYFTSEQILPFDFAEHKCPCQLMFHNWHLMTLSSTLLAGACMYVWPNTCLLLVVAHCMPFLKLVVYVMPSDIHIKTCLYIFSMSFSLAVFNVYSLFMIFSSCFRCLIMSFVTFLVVSDVFT